LKDQLLLLLELQKIDLRVKELQTAMKALPEKLRPVRQDLAKLEGMLTAEKTRLAEAETWRKSQEEALKREEEQLRGARIKLQASRGTKDFAAANREIDNRRKGISEKQEEILKVMEATEKGKGEIAAHEKDVEALRAQLVRDEEEVATKVSELEAEVAQHAAGRGAMRSKVEERYIKIYEAALSKRGYAIAPVSKGVCQGCHMAVPPQLNNILARLESLESCPRCGRLIYRDEFINPKPAEGEPGAGSGAAS
jgi:uncharacterized protein